MYGRPPPVAVAVATKVPRFLQLSLSHGGHSSTAARIPLGHHCCRRRYVVSPPPPPSSSSSSTAPSISPQLHFVHPATPAPTPHGPRLLERQANRELPESEGSPLLRYLPVFALVAVIGSFALINYTRSSSSVVTSCMYSLRRSERARNALGDEITFRSPIPWISGPIDHVAGHIAAEWGVKGRRAPATLRFEAVRPSRKDVYEIVQWNLTMNDGQVIDLLVYDDERQNSQPQSLHALKEALGELGNMQEVDMKGYRSGGYRSGGTSKGG